MECTFRMEVTYKDRIHVPILQPRMSTAWQSTRRRYTRGTDTSGLKLSSYAYVGQGLLEVFVSNRGRRWKSHGALVNQPWSGNDF